MERGIERSRQRENEREELRERERIGRAKGFFWKKEEPDRPAELSWITIQTSFVCPRGLVWDGLAVLVLSLFFYRLICCYLSHS